MRTRKKADGAFFVDFDQGVFNKEIDWEYWYYSIIIVMAITIVTTTTTTMMIWQNVLWRVEV